MQAARRHRHALGVGEADLLGHELAEDDREDGQQAGHDDEGDGRRRCPASGAELGQPGLHAVDQADRRERRGQEAQEVDADLDDRQEAARVGLEALDPDARRVLPSSMSCWSRLRRIVTRAISVAEKTPLSRTRTTMRPSSKTAPLTMGRHPRRVPTRPVGAAVPRPVARGCAPGRRPRACRRGTSLVTTDAGAGPGARRRCRAARRSSCRRR